MSNVLATMLDAGLSLIESLNGGPTFTWNGDSIPCMVNSERRGTVLEIGGLALEVELTLIVRKSLIRGGITADSTIVLVDSTDWTVDSGVDKEPNPGKKLIRKGRTYRIASVRIAGTDSHYELDLVSPNK